MRIGFFSSKQTIFGQILRGCNASCRSPILSILPTIQRWKESPFQKKRSDSTPILGRRLSRLLLAKNSGFGLPKRLCKFAKSKHRKRPYPKSKRAFSLKNRRRLRRVFRRLTRSAASVYTRGCSFWLAATGDLVASHPDYDAVAFEVWAAQSRREPMNQVYLHLAMNTTQRIDQKNAGTRHEAHCKLAPNVKSRIVNAM